MHILAHRGYWLTPTEKNSRAALQRAFTAGMGVETDIRDLSGELVISHDMPQHDALPLAAVLEDYVRAGQPGWFALNIKSDGLTAALHRLLAHYALQRYFCFDMSVPDTLPYLRAGMCTAARLSEYEPEGLLSEQAPVLWVDGFAGQTVSPARLRTWLERGKQVCLVSPELHGRHPDALWALLASLPDAVRRHPGLMLCTDLPDAAREALV